MVVLSEIDYNNLSFAAAALIRATCTSEKPPDDVEQSRPGFALQKGHAKLSGEVGRTGGTTLVEGFRFAMPQHDTPRKRYRVWPPHFQQLVSVDASQSGKVLLLPTSVRSSQSKAQPCSEVRADD